LAKANRNFREVFRVLPLRKEQVLRAAVT